MRLIRCVWRGTKKAAGNNCQGADRPTVVRECDAKLDPCPMNPVADGQGPFKGWRNWRGWELYQWDPNMHVNFH